MRALQRSLPINKLEPAVNQRGPRELGVLPFDTFPNPNFVGLKGKPVRMVYQVG
jgi:hypothetical protein